MVEIEELSELVSKLHTGEAKINFLEAVYNSGNYEAFDIIMSMRPGTTGLLEEEIKRAKENKQTDRFNDLSKKLVDTYIERSVASTSQLFYLKNILFKTISDNKISDYALERAESRLGIFDYSDSYIVKILRNMIDIAEKADNPKSQKYREMLLKKQIILGDLINYHSEAAQTCIESDKYDLAIDLYLKDNDFNQIESAFNIAEKHVPRRINEIAEEGFNLFNISKIHKNYAQIKSFIKYADLLDKSDEAKAIVYKFAKKVKPSYDPDYSPLIEVLLDLNFEDLAEKLVNKIEKYINKWGGFSRTIGIRDVAKLHTKLGNIDKAEELYKECIKDEKYIESHYIKLCDEVYDLKKNPMFLEIKLKRLEKEKKYDLAEATAEKLGDKQLAQAYHKMHEITKNTKKD